MYFKVDEINRTSLFALAVKYGQRRSLLVTTLIMQMQEGNFFLQNYKHFDYFIDVLVLQTCFNEESKIFIDDVIVKNFFLNNDFAGTYRHIFYIHTSLAMKTRGKR